MRLDIAPRRLPTPAGEPVALAVEISNTGDLISGYTVRVLGADPAWVQVDEPQPRLFPGESTTVGVLLSPPDSLPAGERRIAIQVRELSGSQRTSVEEVVLEVPERRELAVTLDPTTVHAGRRGTYGVFLENRGNTTVAGRVVGTDPERRITFRFDPPRFDLAPGEHAVLELRAGARRRLFGAIEARTFELRVDDGRRPPPPQPELAPVPGASGSSRAAVTSHALDAPASDGVPPDAMGVLVQRPVFTRGLLALLGLLLAVTVFAVVITTALGSVVQQSAADRDLALQVAQARDQPARAGTSSVSGQVRLLSTGEPVGSVSVEIFAEADTAAPVATTSTADDGSFGFSALPAGGYKLRFRGAGFAEVWYPTAPTDADAEVVTVEEGRDVTGLTVLVGGVPASVSGTVVGPDVAGATVRLELPLDLPPLAGAVPPEPGEAPTQVSSGAVVRSVPVGGDGTFELTQVPSPAVYDLVTSRPGATTQVQRIDVAAGEVRTGLEIQLLDGDGSISGVVTGTDGPIGGASVVATFGDASVRTVSLTQDQVGAFTLRGLPTPGTFTVVVTAEGFAPATLTLDLGPGQQLTGVGATLGAAAGSLSGVVTAPGDAGGVTVTVTDGAMTRQTVTQSSAPAGSWTVAGLRIPSTYTVTFSRADLQTQVLSVSIDGFGRVTAGAASAGQVDATMRPATARLAGLVRQSDAAGAVVGPAPNVLVTASSGAQQLAVTTASTPADAAGTFVLEGMTPGTWTVTFSRPGTRPTSMIVTLTAGEERRLEPVLVSPASIGGRVTQGGSGVSGAIVELFLAAEYGTAAPPVATATTDSTGAYRLPDVDAPAFYVVQVRLAPGSPPAATSPPLTLEPSEQETRDFPLGP